MEYSVVFRNQDQVDRDFYQLRRKTPPFRAERMSTEKDPDFKENLETAVRLQDEFLGALWRLKSDANLNAMRVS